MNTTIDGYSVSFIDTAGVRKTDNKVEKEGIRRAIEATEDADLIIEVKDATQENMADVKEANESHLVVYNKADLLNNKKGTGPTSKGVFLVSALQGIGVNKIVDNLSNRFKSTNDIVSSITAR